jgi:hypothetical protein
MTIINITITLPAKTKIFVMGEQMNVNQQIIFCICYSFQKMKYKIKEASSFCLFNIQIDNVY